MTGWRRARSWNLLRRVLVGWSASVIFPLRCRDRFKGRHQRPAWCINMPRLWRGREWLSGWHSVLTRTSWRLAASIRVRLRLIPTQLRRCRRRRRRSCLRWGSRRSLHTSSGDITYPLGRGSRRRVIIQQCHERRYLMLWRRTGRRRRCSRWLRSRAVGFLVRILHESRLLHRRDRALSLGCYLRRLSWLAQGIAERLLLVGRRI